MLTLLTFFILTPLPPVAEVPIVSAEAPTTADIELPPEGEEVDWFGAQISWIKEKIKNKEYGPATGAIIMLAFGLANLLMLRMGKKVRQAWFGHLAVATGVAVGLSAKFAGLQVGAGVWDWVYAGLYGAGVGLTAVGFWSYIGKKIFAKWMDKAEAAGNGG